MSSGRSAALFKFKKGISYNEHPEKVIEIDRCVLK